MQTFWTLPDEAIEGKEKDKKGDGGKKDKKDKKDKDKGGGEVGLVSCPFHQASHGCVTLARSRRLRTSD